jgi:uncharacterized membrane protein SpoIIM required for sporulation
VNEARDTFVADRRPRWAELEKLLGRDRLHAGEWSELASLYRTVCADLSRAQGLSLGSDVQHYLDELAARTHNRLYGVRQAGGVRLMQLIASEFPREIRASWRFFLLAMLLFYVPMAIGLVGALADPEFAPSVLPTEMLHGLEETYKNGELERHSGEDAAMSGFYVFNNVGIAFRCFATGAIVGLGPIFFLVYNGLVLGTAIGYLATVGGLGNLLQYVIGHGPWELTAIAVSGTAGLRLGWAMIDTGGRTRVASLQLAAPGLFRLVMGAAAMLVVAASIEAFWSAGPVPAIGKFIFGFLQVLLVTGWLVLGGRGRAVGA